MVEVYDADSFDLKLQDGRQVRVRLLGVDAPDGGEPLRGHANAFARAKLPEGRTVLLEFGPQMWDSQGRLLAYVWLTAPGTSDVWEATGRMLNAVLLDKGYAHIEAKHENPKYGAVFRSVERSAKRAKRGIWG